MLALFVGIEYDEDVGFFGERGFGGRHADDAGAVGLGEFSRFDEFWRFTGARDKKGDVLLTQPRSTEVHHVGIGSGGGVDAGTDEFVLRVVGDGRGAAETKYIDAARVLQTVYGLLDGLCAYFLAQGEERTGGIAQYFVSDIGDAVIGTQRGKLYGGLAAE